MTFVDHYTREGTLYFFGGELSSFCEAYPFWAVPLDPALEEGVGMLLYETREHWFAAHKTLDPARFRAIACADGPGSAKAKGRDRERTVLRAGWDEGIAFYVMLEGIRKQVAVYPDLRDFLMSTGDRPIAEDSPTDYIWGIRDGDEGFTGKNLLGRAWVTAREELR